MSYEFVNNANFSKTFEICFGDFANSSKFIFITFYSVWFA